MGMYLAARRRDFISNIANAADVFFVTAVIITLLVSRDQRMIFTAFEKICFACSGIILLFWVFKRKHRVAHLAIQGLMAIAYFPTIKHLWGAPANTEPFLVWAIIWVSSTLGVVAAFSSKLENEEEKNPFAVAYALRQWTSVSIMIALMLRLQWK